MICKKCGQELPDDSLFCQYCGVRIDTVECFSTAEIENPQRRVSTKKGILKLALLISIAVVLLFSAAVSGGYYSAYKKACELTLQCEFNKAYDVLWFKDFIKQMDSDLIETIEAGQRYENGDVFSGAIMIFAEANSGNAYAKNVITVLKPHIYEFAVKSYNAEYYSQAERLFKELVPYSDSKKYCELIPIREKKGYFIKSDEIKMLKNMIGFADVNSFLVSNQNMAEIFLQGTWKTSNGSHYFKMEDDGDVSYSLPNVNMSNAYYDINDGIYFLYSKTDSSKTKSVFMFTVKDADTISVYCYKNGKTYTLYRQ